MGKQPNAKGNVSHNSRSKAKAAKKAAEQK